MSVEVTTKPYRVMLEASSKVAYPEAVSDTDTRWLDHAERRAWLTLTALTIRMPAAVDAHLQRAAGLTLYEYYVLAMLSEESTRTLRMSELAARTDASLSRLSHVVSKLERRGLTRRQPCPDDGRVTLAVLSDEGWKMVVDTAPAHVEFVRSMVFDALGPGDVEHVERIGGLLLNTLDPERQLLDRGRP